MRTYNNNTINQNIVLNANINSTPYQLKNIYQYTVVMNITGSPTGTLKLQASNDPETNDTQTNNTFNAPPTKIPTNWADVTGSSFTAAIGCNMWNVYFTGYNWVRVVYSDASSGSSTATGSIIMNAKGV